MSKDPLTFQVLQAAANYSSTSAHEKYMGMSDEEELARIGAEQGLGEVLVDLNEDLRTLGVIRDD
jgi:hypothetical protein